ncbi:MAG: hypothetical protein ACI97A_000233, partial [Planctomycetota bacterium]
MTKNLPILILIAVLSGTSTLDLWAQKQKKSALFTLKNGESIEGVVIKSKKGKLEVQTWLGTRIIPERMIIARRGINKVREAYRKELQSIDAKKITDHVKLARWCLARGFTSGFAAELDVILRLDPGNIFAWGLITKMSPVYRFAKANRQPRDKPRWARKEVDLLYAAAKNQSFLGAAMIRAKLDGLSDDIQLNEAIKFAA